MSIPSLRWRHLLEALAGLAIGLVCLVAFSGTASAGQIDTPAPATATGPVSGLLGGVQKTLDPVLAPVTQGVVQPTITAVGTTLDGVVPGLGTTVQQTVGSVGTTVEHTVGGLGTTVDGVVQPLLPPPPAAPLPGISDLPDLPGVIDQVLPPTVDAVGSTHSGALSADTATAPADDAVTIGAELRSSTSPISSDGRTTAAVAQLSAAPITGDSPLSVPGPQSLPLAVISTVSSALAAGSNGSGGLLLAILVGVAALALRPAQGGMSAWRQTSPDAPSFAIAVPPG